MKANAYLKDENLLTLLSLNNFIVPEIQREYVWGKECNKTAVLQPFLESLKNAAKIGLCHHAHSQENIHIGFLYSYNPIYLNNEGEHAFDECLIDGQQRFTTLFLLLLCRSVCENRIQDFLNLIRWEEGNLAFDYKVRSLTHMFLFDLIMAVEKNGKETIDEILYGKYPNWLMQDYQNDATINAMLGALKTITEVFDNPSDYYFDFLLNRIRFWHFRTDVTSQGEELYITMNSRGEELSGNESSKAQLFSSADQIVWGPKWEIWQTFFWRNRGGNENADKGFNNFLACCKELIRKTQSSPETIEDIDIFYGSLEHIFDHDWKFDLTQTCPTSYCDWIDKFKAMIWNKLNTASEKWSIDDSSKDSSQQERAAIFWPWMYYYYYCTKSNKKIDDKIWVRLLHICYLNGNAGNRVYAGIKYFIEELANYVPPQGKETIFSLHNFTDKDHYLSDENKNLSQIYDGCTSLKDAYELESIVWKIQDEKYFLDASDLGGVTIQNYLSEFQKKVTSVISLKMLLEEFLTNLKMMFPSTNLEKNAILLKRCLLFYSSNGSCFWKQESPYYYRNYETSKWNRIIRTSSFINFYFDMISSAGVRLFSIHDIEQKIIQKQDDFFKTNVKHQQFNQGVWEDFEIAILYDFLTSGKLWSQSKHPDLGFKPQTTGLFPEWPGIVNKVAKKRNQPQEVSVPPTWRTDLQAKFPTVTFTFP